MESTWLRKQAILPPSQYEACVVLIAMLLAANAIAAGRGPLRTALYDGPADDLLERLKSGKIERLVVLKGVDLPVAVAKAIREAGIEIVQTEPRSLKLAGEKQNSGTGGHSSRQMARPPRRCRVREGARRGLC